MAEKNTKTEIYEIMKKYAETAVSQDYPVLNPKFRLSTKDSVYATRDGADFASLKEDDVVKLDAFIQLSLVDVDLKTMFYSQTPYCMKCLAERRQVYAALDDMAQVVGHTVRVIDMRDNNPDRDSDFEKAFKGAVASLVITGDDENGKPTGHTITLGRTPYEAVVAMTVLEKNAEIAYLSDKIGGAKPIPKWEAKLMRLNYKKKYSKAESAVKIAEVE